ncbi:MAG: hypothetical protein ACREEM_24265 [Blastocatellia bacterium]
MSQENSTNEKSQETRKKILLGVLFAVFAGVIYFQFFSGSDAPPSRPAVTSAGSAVTAAASPTPAPKPRPGATPEPIVSQPLNLAAMFSKEGAGAGTGRNIFVYPPPPPPPTPKPTPTPVPVPPPPVTIFSVNPAGVMARTGDFTLTVFGEKIPQDAQGYVDGREFATTFVSATEIKMKVPADAIRSPGNLGIQIRSKTDAKMFSNQASLNVAEPPAPPYKFVGLIVSKNGSMAVLKSQSDDEVVNVVKGQVFGKHWKVISISPQKIEVEDTNIKISHSISFTGETG